MSELNMVIFLLINNEWRKIIMAKNVFVSTNMKSVKYAERIFDAVAAVDVENGTFGYLNGLATGQTHIYNFVAGTKAGLTAGDIVVADNPAWDEDTSRITNQRRDNYVIPAGTAFRVRVVAKGDEFGTAIEGVTTASQANMDVDAYVTIDASTGKLVAATTAAENPIMLGTVVRKYTQGGTLATAAHNYGMAKTIYDVKVETLA
jgi:hypothetical protein